jgi:hypothetical protein
MEPLKKKTSRRDVLEVVAAVIVAIIFGTVVGYFKCRTTTAPNCTELYSVVSGSIVLLALILGPKSQGRK